MISLANHNLITRYYEQYRYLEITFTREIYESLHIAPKQIKLKYKNEQWPCILYSSSLIDAKVILALSNELVELLTQAKSVSLKYSFFNESKDDVFSFYVPCQVAGVTGYNTAKNSYFVQLTFLHKPPDSLIQVLGSLLDAKNNASMRKEERISINDDSLRRLGIGSKKAQIDLDGIQEDCILRDLSFMGIKVVAVNSQKPSIDKGVRISLKRSEKPPITVEGRVLRYEAVVGQSDLTAIVISLTEASSLTEYKMMVNRYFERSSSSRG